MTCSEGKRVPASRFDVFLSYSRKDSVVADRVEGALRDAGLSVWRDTKEQEIGDEWRAEIVTALETSAVCVVLLSEHAGKSAAVRREVSLAAGAGQPILLFRLDSSELPKSIKFDAGHLNWHDAADPPSVMDLAFLVRSVRKHRADRRFPDGQFGDYEIEIELGRSSMATVYRATRARGAARDGEPGTVALKVLNTRVAQDAAVVERLREEALIGRKIEHPNVMRTWRADRWTKDGTVYDYLVLEHVDGQNLADLQVEQGVVPEANVRFIAFEATKGLEAIHAAGAIHRDIKPANILVTRDGHVVKIMDLGMARVVNAVGRLTLSNVSAGPREYASPEQADLRVPRIDARSDLFSLGIVLYELLTGKDPYGGDRGATRIARMREGPRLRVSEHGVRVSLFFEAVVHALLQGDPTDRIGSAAELHGILAEAEDSAWWRARHADAVQRVSARQLQLRPTYPTSVHGREKEIGVLSALLDAAADGNRQSSLVLGEAGIGKTRLVDEFVRQERAAGRELHFLFGSNPPGGSATALGAMTTAFVRQFGRQDLDSRLEPHMKENPGYLHSFAALLLRAAPSADQPAIPADALHVLFGQVVKSLAVERPVVLLIDDVHHLPAEGWQLLFRLSHYLAEHAVLLVATAEPSLGQTLRTQFEAQPDVSRIEPARLDQEAEVALLKDLLGSEDLARRVAQRLSECTGGVPLFLFALVDDLESRGELTRRSDGRWTYASGSTPLAVPEGLAQLVSHRLVSLEEDDRTLLQCAACWGTECDYRLLASALEESRAKVVTRLSKIERRHHLVRSLSARTFAFDHPVIHSAVLQDLPDALRAHYHLALAECHERSHGSAETHAPVDGELAVRLCSQFLHAEEGARALPYLAGALQHLLATHRQREALDLQDRALAIPALIEGTERATTLLNRVELLGALDEQTREDTALTEAEALLDSTEEPRLLAWARARRGWLAQRQADYSTAERALDEGAQFARDAESLELEARILRIRGNMHHRRGQFTRARDCHERHRQLAEELDSDAERLMAGGNLGYALWALGNFPGALESYRQQYEIARSLRQPSSEAIGLVNAGFLLAALGRVDEAGAMLGDGRRIAEECGFLRTRLNAETGLANLEARAGRFEDAEGRLRQIVHDLEPLPSDVLGSEVRRTLGEILYFRGCHHEAMELFEASFRLAESLDSPSERIVSSAWLALLRGKGVDDVRRACAADAHRIAMIARLHVSAILWKASGDPVHAVAYRAIAEEVCQHGPDLTSSVLAVQVPFGDELEQAGEQALNA